MHPYYQKTEIEKIAKELLEVGSIQNSQSPFASPVLLVRKSDGLWSMCLVMPFGLTNATFTFQSLMNQGFKPYLRRFILVFFDDILEYSKTLADHVEHLSVVIEVLAKNQLYAMMSKCMFAHLDVEYLGHIISGEGVNIDPKKILTVQEWPIPRDAKALRGFLGLTSYYRILIRGYG